MYCKQILLRLAAGLPRRIIGLEGCVLHLGANENGAGNHKRDL